MDGASTQLHSPSRSDDELSSLGELDGLNFGPSTTTDAPQDPRDAEDNHEGDDLDTHESVYSSPDPREIHGLVNDATGQTGRLIAVCIDRVFVLPFWLTSFLVFY